MKIPFISGFFNGLSRLNHFCAVMQLHKIERNQEENYGDETPADAAYHKSLVRDVVSLADRNGENSSYFNDLRRSVQAQDRAEERKRVVEAVGNDIAGEGPVHNPSPA